MRSAAGQRPDGTDRAGLSTEIDVPAGHEARVLAHTEQNDSAGRGGSTAAQNAVTLPPAAVEAAEQRGERLLRLLSGRVDDGARAVGSGAAATTGIVREATRRGYRSSVGDGREVQNHRHEPGYCGGGISQLRLGV